MQLQKKDGTPITGSCRRVTQHVIEVLLDGELPPADDLIGFRLLRDDGSLLFDSTGYDTVYREIEGGYQLSDDGSTYTPPPEPEEPVIPEEPAGESAPTIPERVSALEKVVYNNIGG